MTHFLQMHYMSIDAIFGLNDRLIVNNNQKTNCEKNSLENPN